MIANPLETDTCLLVINVGSSTMKIAAYSLKTPAAAIFSLVIELESGVVYGKGMLANDWADFLPYTPSEDMLEIVLDQLQKQEIKLSACVHRVVHGGQQREPQWLTPTMLAELEMLEPLCPLHQPPALDVIHFLRGRLPALPQIAVFDTSFHLNQPKLAVTYALPAELRNAGIQAYGFHGISCQHLLRRLGDMNLEQIGQRLIIAHLGSSASLTAVSNGRSLACTIGFSPLDGLPIETRCGHIDAGILLYLLEQGWSKSRLLDLLYHRSGLLGLSEVSGKMGELLASRAETAHFAIDYFCYRAGREIASLAAVLQGIDILVFTGGIGEHLSEIREKIVHQLQWLGAKLDDRANDQGKALISINASSFLIMVISSDEQQEMCWQSLALLAKRGLMPAT